MLLSHQTVRWLELFHIAAFNAQGLDKLSKSVDLQTKALENLVKNSENQNELIAGVFDTIKQLNDANDVKPTYLQSPPEISNDTEEEE